MPNTNVMLQSITVQSPGRINIIGEHTDYNDGFVLPAAIDKKTVAHLHRNGQPTRCRITAGNLDETLDIDLDQVKPLAGGWQNYVLGVVHELQKLGAQILGFEGSFQGDVPIGGGMSSSASLECALAFGLNELFDLRLSKTQLIKAAQMAEHNFVGIKCGIMDQFASMMGQKDQVILLDCRSLEYRYFPLELGDYQLLLLHTNVSHSLASSEYNRRRSECEEGVAMIRKKHPEVQHLRDVSLPMLTGFQGNMPETLYTRCRHVVSENQRVLDATQALTTGDIPKLGRLLYQSHHSLQHDYAVSCPELDFLVDQTTGLDFVAGSRMMGGGFGGCTINIIEKKHGDQFVEKVAENYRARFGVDLTPYSVSIEDGAGVLSQAGSA